MFETCNPLPPPSLDDTEATWVSTPEDFQQMLAKLKNATEIAVDLEHHSYRSYFGFLCLLQISDRNEDWVVDLLAVRDEVESLNEVFTDPNIVKVRYLNLLWVDRPSRFSQVFHGAESDIVWLQQDFNIYIVNLFDTFHASKLLGQFPCFFSSAFLVPPSYSYFQTSRDTGWQICSKCTATSYQTNVTNWQIGGYGKPFFRCFYFGLN